MTARGSLVPSLTGLVVAIACLLPAAAFAGPRSFDTGVTVPDAGHVPELGYERINQAGAKLTRVTIFWSRVAPQEQPAGWDRTDPNDPNYNWTSPDHQIMEAAAAGLRTMIQIHSAPAWAERCQSPGEPGICNPDPVEFQRFTRAVVERYSGNVSGLPKVRFWEPWNEPNLHIFFEPQRMGSKRPSPGLYRTLLNRFAAVVKNHDASNVVVAGGLAPLGGTASTHPLTFMRRLLCMKGRAKPKPNPRCRATSRFDIWATNPYTTGGPTHSAIHRDDVQLGDLPEVTKLIRAAKRADRIRSDRKNIGLWVTEFSWDSAPPDPGGLKMPVLKRWMAEAMFRSWKAGFDTFFWLSIRDWDRSSGLPYSETYESGLWFRGETIEQDTRKGTLRVFRAPFVAIRRGRGMVVWGRTVNSKPGRVAIKFGPRTNRVERRIKTVHANRFGVFKTFFRTNSGRNKRGFVTATSRGFTSTPYPLRPQRDFYHPPFGKKL